MQYIVQFFSWIMDLCYQVVPNHWVDIIIFTLITKVLAGRDSGRRSADERLICYNIGLALHDTWFASRIYDMMEA